MQLGWWGTSSCVASFSRGGGGCSGPHSPQVWGVPGSTRSTAPKECPAPTPLSRQPPLVQAPAPARHKTCGMRAKEGRKMDTLRVLFVVVERSFPKLVLYTGSGGDNQPQSLLTRWHMDTMSCSHGGTPGQLHVCSGMPSLSLWVLVVAPVCVRHRGGGGLERVVFGMANFGAGRI